jgi:hypothetical protein
MLAIGRGNCGDCGADDQPSGQRAHLLAGKPHRGLGTTRAGLCQLVPSRRWPDIGDRRRIIGCV